MRNPTLTSETDVGGKSREMLSDPRGGEAMNRCIWPPRGILNFRWCGWMIQKILSYFGEGGRKWEGGGEKVRVLGWSAPNLPDAKSDLGSS